MVSFLKTHLPDAAAVVEFVHCLWVLNSLAREAFPISRSSGKVAFCYTSQYVPGMEKKLCLPQS